MKQKIKALFLISIALSAISCNQHSKATSSQNINFATCGDAKITRDGKDRKIIYVNNRPYTLFIEHGFENPKVKNEYFHLYEYVNIENVSHVDVVNIAVKQHKVHFAPYIEGEKINLVECNVSESEARTLLHVSTDYNKTTYENPELKKSIKKLEVKMP